MPVSIRFIFASESYGGHYGPAFVSYFESQNALISSGKLSGVVINVGALMINKSVTSSLPPPDAYLTRHLVNSGWIDPALQYLAYINYGSNAPGYGPLVSASTIKSANSSYYKSGGCLSQIQACYAASPANVSASSSDSTCENADNYCVRYPPICLFLLNVRPNVNTFFDLQYENIEDECINNQDVYDVRQQNPDPYPPEYYVNYLQQSSVQTAIGAQQQYSECPDAPYNKFANTGDVSPGSIRI